MRTSEVRHLVWPMTQWSIDYALKNHAMNVPGKRRKIRNAFVGAALAAVETCQ
jgi:hypothetical protein